MTRQERLARTVDRVRYVATVLMNLAFMAGFVYLVTMPLWAI